MPGGSIRVTVDTYFQLEQVTQRVLCWALTDKGKIKIDTGTPVPSVVIPEEVIAGKGALILKRGGTDLTSGYVASSNVTFGFGNNQLPMNQNPNTCAVITQQPNATSIATGIGGNPMATTLTYANFATAGTVNIDWGDGTATNGAAESGTSNHTYPGPGSYKITITDASVGTDLGNTWVRVP